MTATATLYRAAMLPGNDLGNITSERQLPDGRNSPLILPLPSNGSLVNRSFRYRMYGRVAAAISNLFTINVYFGKDPVIANNVIVFSSGAQVVNSQSNFELWIDMTWDNDSKVITGRGEGYLANNILGPMTLLNRISADPNRDSNTFLQSGPSYGFTATGLFNSSSTGNHCYVDQMALEDI